MILSAVYMLWMVQRVYYGPVTNEKNASLPDLSVREWAAAAAARGGRDRDGPLPDIFPQARRARGRAHRVARDAGPARQRARGWPPPSGVRVARPTPALPVPVAAARGEVRLR